MSEAIKYINETYDIREEHSARVIFDFEVDLDKRVTILAGGSGTGKTTLLRKMFNEEHIGFKDFLGNKESVFELLLSNESEEEFKEVSKLLFDVGLSSVPVWKNTYDQLSNGEKLRFEIAYKLKQGNEMFYIDEFTSMLDRQTAKNMSLKLNEMLNKYNKRVVLATAHFDVLDWVECDQLVDTNLKKSRALQEPTLITLTNWRYERYQETCGEHLVTITI